MRQDFYFSYVFFPPPDNTSPESLKSPAEDRFLPVPVLPPILHISIGCPCPVNLTCSAGRHISCTIAICIIPVYFHCINVDLPKRIFNLSDFFVPHN